MHRTMSLKFFVSCLKHKEIIHFKLFKETDSLAIESVVLTMCAPTFASQKLCVLLTQGIFFSICRRERRLFSDTALT